MPTMQDKLFRLQKKFKKTQEIVPETIERFVKVVEAAKEEKRRLEEEREKRKRK